MSGVEGTALDEKPHDWELCHGLGSSAKSAMTRHSGRDAAAILSERLRTGTGPDLVLPRVLGSGIPLP